MAFAWVVIIGRLVAGESRTTMFTLPRQVAELIDKGYEPGTANNMVFNKHSPKQKASAVGLLNKNSITRTQLYQHKPFNWHWFRYQTKKCIYSPISRRCGP